MQCEGSRQSATPAWFRDGWAGWQPSEMAAQNGRQVIVAMHGRKPIPIGTLKSIIEGSGLDVEDFR